jgi:hypothetical protein
MIRAVESPFRIEMAAKEEKMGEPISDFKRQTIDEQN